MARNRSIVIPHHRAITTQAHMKKNRDSSDLAARIAAAARQPAGTGAVPVPVLVATAPTAKPQISEPAAPVRAQQKKAKPEIDTVPITLRPSSALLSKFVLKAAERTREEGRVVSAQQIMLEALERSLL
jgi:hypothetical protein